MRLLQYLQEIERNTDQTDEPRSQVEMTVLGENDGAMSTTNAQKALGGDQSNVMLRETSASFADKSNKHQPSSLTLENTSPGGDNGILVNNENISDGTNRIPDGNNIRPAGSNGGPTENSGKRDGSTIGNGGPSGNDGPGGNGGPHRSGGLGGNRGPNRNNENIANRRVPAQAQQSMYEVIGPEKLLQITSQNNIDGNIGKIDNTNVKLHQVSMQSC